MGEWQSIETAPKDGTRILAWDGDFVEITWWAKTSHVPLYGWVDVAASQPEDIEITLTPTHWMPLPKPPKESSDE